MNSETQIPEKTRFSEVCQRCNLDYQAMQALADKAGLQKQVIDAMAVSVAVRRADALKILKALSEHTGQTWTLNNVKVAIMPTFPDFHSIHQFDLDTLSTTSGVSFDTIRMMLHREPVPTKEASSVLMAASKQTSQHYRLNNVDVKLSDRK